MTRSTSSRHFMSKWVLLTILIAIPISLLMYWSVAQFEPWWVGAFTPDTIAKNPVYQSQLIYQQTAAQWLQIATVICALLIASATAFEFLRNGLRANLSLAAVSPLGWVLVWTTYGLFQKSYRASVLFPMACIPISIVVYALYQFSKGERRWLSAFHVYVAITFFALLSMQLFWLNLDDFLINAAID